MYAAEFLVEMLTCAMKNEFMLESRASASTHHEKNAFMSAIANLASACINVVWS